MFGDGVFGPEGIVWCCALGIGLPIFYVGLFSALMRISFSLAVRATALATVILTYIGAGYFFGDAVGMIAAVFMFIAVLPTFVMKSQRSVINFGREKAKRVFRDNMSGGTFIFGEAIEPDDENNWPEM